MTYYTWSQIKTKIKRDMDLEGETFVTEPELLGYANDAIDEAEAEIHGMYEDYFLARSTITMVVAAESYDFPADIYAHKIRRLVFNDGSSVYEVERLRDWTKFENYEWGLNNATTDLYRYFIDNSTSGSPKIILSPKSTHAGAFIKIFYIRNANRLTIDADKCDIPEFIEFIYKYIRVKVYEKEGNPVYMVASAELERQRELMRGTLANMVPDANNKIELDLGHYEEMS